MSLLLLILALILCKDSLSGSALFSSRAVIGAAVPAEHPLARPLVIPAQAGAGDDRRSISAHLLRQERFQLSLE